MSETTIRGVLFNNREYIDKADLELWLNRVVRKNPDMTVPQFMDHISDCLRTLGVR